MRAVTVVSLLLAAAQGCNGTPVASPKASASANKDPVERESNPTDAPWPPDVALSQSEYEQRLFTAFERCEQFDLGRLNGRWTVASAPSDPSLVEVWICDGHFRWRNDIGLVNDICITRLTKVRDGLNCEGVWHEDWHDPGDAGGLYVRLRELDNRLSVEASAWDSAPTQFTPFFTLERTSAAGGHLASPFD